MYTSPSTDLYSLGKGIISFDRFDADGLPTGLRDLGNCPTFTLAPTEETLKHYSSREGVRRKDKEVTLLQELGGKFTLDEYDKENLRLSLFGESVGWSIKPLTAGSIFGTLDFVGTNDIGPRFHVQLWRCKLKPTGEVNFLAETTWGQLNFEVSIESDVTNHPTSPYGEITLINES